MRWNQKKVQSTVRICMASSRHSRSSRRCTLACHLHNRPRLDVAKNSWHAYPQTSGTRYHLGGIQKKTGFLHRRLPVGNESQCCLTLFVLIRKCSLSSLKRRCYSSPPQRIRGSASLADRAKTQPAKAQVITQNQTRSQRSTTSYPRPCAIL